MKGKGVEGEVKDARRAIPILGGKLLEVKDITVSSPEESLTHPVIIIDKIQKTPSAYPRPYAKISKKPL
jgi:16S rRNA (guanine527-N7)-methyltransferase